MNISVGSASCTNAQRNWIFLDVSIETHYMASLRLALLKKNCTPADVRSQLTLYMLQSRIKSLEPMKKINVPPPGIQRDAWLVMYCLNVSTFFLHFSGLCLWCQSMLQDRFPYKPLWYRKIILADNIQYNE